MAHFLEHLVFKGGQKYDDYRKVNETAERMGAVLNAYTSHDLVAFHITCRAEVVGEAIDLLTDFVGRPKIDAGELDRERGVVIQEIARAKDQPSVVAEHLIDRAAFGDHPLGRPVLGPEEHLRTFTREAIVAVPVAPVGGLARRRVRGRQPAALAGRLRAGRGVRPLPVDLAQRRQPSRRRRSRRRRSSSRATPTSRTCGSPTARRSIRATRGPRRAGRLLDAAGRLDGLAAVRRDPRAARPRLLRLLGRPLVRRRADPAALRRPGVGQVRRGVPRGCGRSSTSCAPKGRTRTSSSAPARTRRAAACWRSRTPTRSPATRRRSRSCSARTSIRTRRSPRSTAPRSTRSPTSRAGSRRRYRWHASGRTRWPSSPL